MNLQLVTFPIAKLLKEAGFDLTTDWFFNSESSGGLGTEPIDWNAHNEYSRPDLPTVTRWLREVHNLHIALIPSSELAYWKVRVYSSDGYENMTGSFDSHDSALSAGISYCLTLLKEKK